jgi:hypothetical protein
MPISIRQLHPVFVGEVEGVDCRKPNGPVQFSVGALLGFGSAMTELLPPTPCATEAAKPAKCGDLRDIRS